MHSTLPVHQTILSIHSPAVQETPWQVNQPRPPLAALPVQKRCAKLLFPFGRSGPVRLELGRRVRQHGEGDHVHAFARVDLFNTNTISNPAAAINF